MSPLDLAASIHTTHLERAARALKHSPPQLHAFWIHSRICDVMMDVVHELQLLPETTVSPILSDSALAAGPQQPTQDAVNPANPGETSPLV
jgi:hypothetical protein